MVHVVVGHLFSISCGVQDRPENDVRVVGKKLKIKL
jgi:hypothetical protein